MVARCHQFIGTFHRAAMYPVFGSKWTKCNSVYDTLAKCLFCLILLLPRASAVDLCGGGEGRVGGSGSEIVSSVLDSHYQHGVRPVDGLPKQAIADPSPSTPLACATSCCGSLSCDAIFFMNKTCYLIKCSNASANGCSVLADVQYTDSYWLLLRTLPESSNQSSSLTSVWKETTTTSAWTATPIPSLSSNTSAFSSSTTSTPVSTLSVLAPLGLECNMSSSNCSLNEQCIPVILNAATAYHCVCVAGYQRAPSTNMCIQTTDATNNSIPFPTVTPPTATPPTPTPPTPKPAVETLVVSAGENRTIQWPQNEVTVNAFVLPEKIGKDNYKYQWSLFAHPEGDETGAMENIDSASLKLSKLRIGTYTFKVTVSAEGKYGESYVSITVLPANTEKQRPVAIAKPSYQEIYQPNDLIIDGSGSTADGKIVRYQWDQVSGPLDSQMNIDFSNLDKPTLILKGLAPGSYRFKLIVTDSDGFQNDTYANATVIKETDYPPKANAGSDIIINLPQTSVTLMGNASQDDKGIISYEWTKKSEKSDDKLTGDMLGVRTPFLQLSNLQLGDYTFTLTVTDSAKQTSSADVHVYVKPERNQAPVSRAGADRTIWLPDESLLLDGSNSTDDQKIVSYLWTPVSGPSVLAIQNANDVVATVSKMIVGEYKFKLTVKDNEGLESSSHVVITVKENPNRPPTAKAGGNRVIVLPAPLVIINGSLSSDDKGIVSYLWIRDKNSPAAGDVVPFSDHQPMLHLVNVVPGQYTFTLKVTDAEGLDGHDSMILEVEKDPYELNLVEVYLSVDISSFLEGNQLTLKDQLSLLLRKSSSAGEPNVMIRRIAEDASTGRTLVVFYVESLNKHQKEVWLATDVVHTLKKLRSSLDILEIQIAKFEPAVCQNNCSGHGVCDQTTKLCICDGFWMEDIFKSYFGEQESNCDWSVLYVVIVVFCGVVAFGGCCWAVVCYCKRCRCSYWKPKLKRIRYSGIESQVDDPYKLNEQVELIPKVRTHQNSSLMQSDSELSSEELLYDNTKRATNGFAKKLNNGSAVATELVLDSAA